MKEVIHIVQNGHSRYYFVDDFSEVANSIDEPVIPIYQTNLTPPKRYPRWAFAGTLYSFEDWLKVTDIPESKKIALLLEYS